MKNAYAAALRDAADRMDAERNGNEETWFSVFGDTLRAWADEGAPSCACGDDPTYHHEADEGTVCCICGQPWTCQGYIDQIDPSRDPVRATWLEGYEWALSHLTDPGVLADARRLALAHESAETAREAPARTVEPHGTYHGAATPPVASSPQHFTPTPRASAETEESSE